jgi:hypothetical protein
MRTTLVSVVQLDACGPAIKRDSNQQYFNIS